MVRSKSRADGCRRREGNLITGYTTGVFDLFHVGHVNLLRNAKSLCDRLVVGVSVDELASGKGRIPVIPFSERIEVVRSCRFVDVAIPQANLDKYVAWKKLKFHRLFVGDDWFEDPGWSEMERKLGQRGVGVTFFPYTSANSSTLINQLLLERSKPRHGGGANANDDAN